METDHSRDDDEIQSAQRPIFAFVERRQSPKQQSERIDAQRLIQPDPIILNERVVENSGVDDTRRRHDDGAEHDRPPESITTVGPRPNHDEPFSHAAHLDFAGGQKRAAERPRRRTPLERLPGCAVSVAVVSGRGNGGSACRPWVSTEGGGS